MNGQLFKIPEWVESARISRSAFYELPDEKKPHAIKVGKAVVIRESPRSWAQRIARADSVPAPKAKRRS